MHASTASHAAEPRIHSGVACLLWLVLAAALSPTLLDWWRHLVAEPNARYAALFVPLVAHLAWVRPSAEPRRALALWVVIAAVLFAFLAVGGGVTRMGRLAVPFAVLGMSAWLGRPGSAVVGLAFFAIPVPNAVLEKVALLLEGLPASSLALEPADTGLGLAALFAGFGYHAAVTQGAGMLRGMQRASRSALYAVPVQLVLLFAAIGVASTGEGVLARTLLTHAAVAVGAVLLLARVLAPRPQPGARLTRKKGGELVAGLLTGARSAQELKVRDDAATLRLELEPGSSAIVKLWKRPGLIGHLRRMTGTDPAAREFRALTTLREAGIAAPEPLGVASFRHAGSAYTDALLLEDLGSCETALEHLKHLIRNGEEARAAHFVTEVVEMTAAIVEGDIIDTDHSLNNLVVTARGGLVRLDTEIARSCRGRPAKPYGDMLGRLLGTFVFAVQPDVERVAPFANALASRLDPDPAVLRGASAHLEEMLETQRRTTSLDVWVTLPWDEVA